jgi:medium-chain acyl-[acyl-carrier-protein] hydrolase
MPTQDPWIIRSRPAPNARLRLFCIPCAGRGASLYRGWTDFSNPEIELCFLQLPGRENRLRERPFTRIPDAVDQLVEILQPYLDRPFALFGHSMGAILCFELARALRNRNKLAPEHLFVSARRAPHRPDPRPPLHPLPDPEFIAEIRHRYDGLPENVLADSEIMELLLPLLRADVQMIETYMYEPAPPLDCPITAFGGSQDSDVAFTDLEHWRMHTSGRFEASSFRGGHFFVQSMPGEITRAIAQSLDLAPATSVSLKPLEGC